MATPPFLKSCLPPASRSCNLQAALFTSKTKRPEEMNSSGQISCPLRFTGDKNQGLRFLTSCSNPPFRPAFKMLKSAFREVLPGPHDPRTTLCCYTIFKLPRNRLHLKMKMAQRRNASEPNLWSGRSAIGTKKSGLTKNVNEKFISKNPGDVNCSRLEASGGDVKQPV